MSYERTSKESFAFYRQWRKHIGTAKIDLRKGHDGYQRITLIAVAERIAEKGTNGLGCYAGDQVIADELDVQRNTVTKYKRLLVDELGWLVKTGKRKGRAEVLDIAIPEPDAMVSVAEPEPASQRRTEPSRARTTAAAKPATVARHDPTVFPEKCPACQQQWSEDELRSAPDAVLEEHLGVRLRPYEDED